MKRGSSCERNIEDPTSSEKRKKQKTTLKSDAFAPKERASMLHLLLSDMDKESSGDSQDGDCSSSEFSPEYFLESSEQSSFSDPESTEIIAEDNSNSGESEEEETQKVEKSTTKNPRRKGKNIEKEKRAKITHVFISTLGGPGEDAMISYGFDIESSPKYGKKIVKAIQDSIVEFDMLPKKEEDEKKTIGGKSRRNKTKKVVRGENHTFLMDYILALAFHDEKDDDIFKKEDRLEWEALSSKLFGSVLGNEDVGEWYNLSSETIHELGKVVVTVVKCYEWF